MQSSSKDTQLGASGRNTQTEHGKPGPSVSRPTSAANDAGSAGLTGPADDLAALSELGSPQPASSGQVIYIHAANVTARRCFGSDDMHRACLSTAAAVIFLLRLLYQMGTKVLHHAVLAPLTDQGFNRTLITKSRMSRGHLRPN